MAKDEKMVQKIFAITPFYFFARAEARFYFITNYTKTGFYPCSCLSEVLQTFVVALC